MNAIKAWALGAVLAFSASLAAAQDMPARLAAEVERLRAHALQSDRAFRIVEDLTISVGPRLAGSPAEARARDWAQAMLRANGFTNVRSEPFSIPFWARQVERAEVISPAPQPLIVAALAGSPSTPAGGITAPVVRFESLAALSAAPRASVEGRIVFIDEGMERARDGSGYGRAVQRRGQCPARAQAQGALACLIRSVGTDRERVPHVGGSARQPGGANLPAAALTPPDADQLARLIARGETRLRLVLETEMRENAQSGNVIGEIRGRTRPEEIVLLGAHLDSWDLGTGAVDDGAGVAIVTAAAAMIRQAGLRPERTIRVVLYGAEETGALGGPAYRNAHANELARHAVIAEADFGAGRVYSVQTRFGPPGAAFAQSLAAALAPLGIAFDPTDATGGADIAPLREAGVPSVDLNQDGTYYFDVHHTPNDTLNRVSPEDIRQAAAAYAVFAYLAAQTSIDLRRPSP